MVAQMSKVRSAEMIIQYNLGRPFRAVTFKNFGSVTLKFFSALPVSRQISRTICRNSTSRSINNAFGNSRGLQRQFNTRRGNFY